jgi:hypothetical protein
MSEIIYLATSLGEAIDKLTILDIKLDNISDNRRDNVKKEYDLLYEKLEKNIVKYNELYLTMKKVNLLIWNMMDKLRDGDLSSEEYLQVCRVCVDYNDVRFRVKSKINNICDSYLKEEKGYKINKLVIIIKQEVDDNSTLLNIIKYFSFVYDEVNVVCNFDLKYLKQHFLYDESILFKTDLEYENESSINYKCKITIDNINYSEEDLYKLFNVSTSELSKILVL